MKAKLFDGANESNHQKAVDFIGDIFETNCRYHNLMASLLNSRLLSFRCAVSRAAGRILAVVGFLVLADWLFDIFTLKSALLGLATTKANTAAFILLIGASLWLSVNLKPNWQLGILRARSQKGFLEGVSFSYFILLVTAGKK